MFDRWCRAVRHDGDVVRLTMSEDVCAGMMRRGPLYVRKLTGGRIVDTQITPALISAERDYPGRYYTGARC